MFNKVIIFSLGLLSLINCNAQKEPKKNAERTWSSTEIKETTPMKGENIIYFNEGEKKFLKEYQMNVAFKWISEDSRCPKEVNCIWAGVAVAEMELMGTTTRPMTIKLASLDNKGRNYNKSVDFNGYTITLVDVNPYPTQEVGANALHSKYKIGITIKKAGENPTTK
ncbi:hypothetical protein GCM10023210_05630 [Chryseobacterium ginsengisoli]|uniref:Lipoprotein n=1 Tax=Chryseobacterium ginsengisoli TaxID=363853 RepID=A0ABP9LTF3_9FLAO